MRFLIAAAILSVGATQAFADVLVFDLENVSSVAVTQVTAMRNGGEQTPIAFSAGIAPGVTATATLEHSGEDCTYAVDIVKANGIKTNLPAIDLCQTSRIAIE